MTHMLYKGQTHLRLVLEYAKEESRVWTLQSGRYLQGRRSCSLGHLQVLHLVFSLVSPLSSLLSARTSLPSPLFPLLFSECSLASPVCSLFLLLPTASVAHARTHTHTHARKNARTHIRLHALPHVRAQTHRHAHDTHEPADTHAHSRRCAR